MKYLKDNGLTKEELLNRVKKFISPKVGIVKGVIEISRSVSEPPIFSTSCQLCNTQVFRILFKKSYKM